MIEILELLLTAAAGFGAGFALRRLVDLVARRRRVPELLELAPITCSSSSPPAPAPMSADAITRSLVEICGEAQQRGVPPQHAVLFAVAIGAMAARMGTLQSLPDIAEKLRRDRTA